MSPGTSPKKMGTYISFFISICHVVVLTAVNSLTSITTNKEVTGIENTIKLYNKPMKSYATRLCIRSLTESEQVSHLHILKTTSLGSLKYYIYSKHIHYKEHSRDSKEHKDPNGPTPIN